MRFIEPCMSIRVKSKQHYSGGSPEAQTTERRSQSSTIVEVVLERCTSSKQHYSGGSPAFSGKNRQSSTIVEVVLAISE